MKTQRFLLSPPALEQIADSLKASLEANFEQVSISVVPCPDLREAPFLLAAEGLCGEEKVADIGGQSYLFPRPCLEKVYSMTDIARKMEMDSQSGSIIGAGAGPFNTIGQNCELSANFGWQVSIENIENRTRYAMIDRDTHEIRMKESNSLDCALMANLYGSLGKPGPVLKIAARKRIGPEKSFTECIRKGLHATYGDSETVSLGGVFLIKSGRTHYHVMPDFPGGEELPFKDFQHLNDWLTYHDFDGPITCLSVLHSADPGKKMGLRMEHTHGYSPIGENAGGHYHYEAQHSKEEVEYLGYFNTAKMIYRVDMPDKVLDRDLHD